eukprot:gene11197-11347_t
MCESLYGRSHLSVRAFEPVEGLNETADMVWVGIEMMYRVQESAYGRRIVFFGAAEDTSEAKLLQLFSQYGEVTGLFVVRSVLGLPCGCGYVTMANPEQASAACKALNGSTACAEAGDKLGLLMIDTGSCRQASQQQQSSTSTDCNTAAVTLQVTTAEDAAPPMSPAAKEGRTVFFTKVPPTVTAHQLIQLFTSCGEVIHLELFTPWPGAKISKGCGLVEFASADAASAAVHSLHQAFTWPHSHSPLVVEWVDSNRQAANRASKARSASGAPPADDGSARRTNTLCAEARKLIGPANAGAGVVGQPSGVFPGGQGFAGQSQLEMHSCPLPQASWLAAQAGAAGASGNLHWVSPALAVVSQVLQELARISGTQAVLAGDESGSVQLVLTGRPVEVQAAHSVANMMLAKIGVEEPLLPVVSGLSTVPRRSH